MNPAHRLMRLAPIIPLALLAACGGGADSKAQTQAPAPANRAAVVVYTPAKDKVVAATASTGKQLRAVVRITGRAAPGQQLSLRGD